MSDIAAYFPELCRLVVFITFAAAATAKVTAPGEFRAALGGLLPIGREAAWALAVVIIALETMVAALLLAGGQAARAGMVAAAILLVLFSAAIASALARGRTVSCNCFGSRARPVSRHDLWRNGALIGVSLLYLMAPPGARPFSLLEQAGLFGLAALIFLAALGLPARRARPSDEPLVPLVGRKIPPLDARRSDGRSLAPLTLEGTPFVLVFVAARCKSCAGKVRELIELLPGANKAGVGLWLAAPENPDDLLALVDQPALARRVVTLAGEARRALNPFGAAPVYVFVDERGVVQAGDYIGDENWSIFAAEMRNMAAAKFGEGQIRGGDGS